MKLTEPSRRLAIVAWVLVVIGITSASSECWTAQTQRADEPVSVIGTRQSVQLPVRTKAQPPAPLAAAEKVRRVKAFLQTLRDVDQKDRSLGLDRSFPLGLAAQATLKFPKLQAENILTPRKPYIGTTAYLSFAQPSYVSGYGNNAYFPAAVPADGVHLTTYLDVTAGKTYLLDYYIGSNPPPVRVVIVNELSQGIELLVTVSNGHLLVPFQATATHIYTIFVDPRTTPFEFFSLEINTVE